jgi:hypothetical protein
MSLDPSIDGCCTHGDGVALPLALDDFAKRRLVPVDESGRIEGAPLLLDDLLGDLQHARIRLRQVERADARKLPHFFGVRNVVSRISSSRGSSAQMRSRVLITRRPIAIMFFFAMAARITANAAIQFPSLWTPPQLGDNTTQMPSVPSRSRLVARSPFALADVGVGVSAGAGRPPVATPASSASVLGVEILAERPASAIGLNNDDLQGRGYGAP